MTRPTTRQAILRRHACRSLLISHYAVRCALAIHHGSGWLFDRLEALSTRQRLHAFDLSELGGRPVPDHVRQR